ncbi:hypothetical protein [Pseudomonas kitaguniensis]|uniref:hypothetical protein n=1 Tax=Pseudomonas kitaguniensis TaxID=2607908 RepID=UPI003D05CCEC
MSLIQNHSLEVPDAVLKQRAIDGTLPITGEAGPTRPSAQFKSWRVQLAVLEEANSRETRQMEPFTGEDEYGNPIIRMEMQDCGRGYTPNGKFPDHPKLNEKMNGAVVKFDRESKKPYTAFPVSKR